MARTKRKDHGLFDHPNLPQGPPRRTGELRMISLVRGIWVLALAIITSVIAPGVAMADHTYLPWKIFKFTGSPAAGVQDRHDFTIDQDGALYFTLKSFTPGAEVPGWTPVLEIGFYPKNQSLCPFRYASTTKDPPGGTTFGPYYVAAGAYQSVYSLVGAATTGYELEIAYHPQLIPNDVELNDSPETAQNVGDIYPGEHMTGHLAYLEGGVSGCKHNKHDYIRFRMLSTGNYQVRIHYDPAFRDKPGCVVWFALHDDTASMWVLNHTGPADVTLGPIAFHAGRQYLVSMESSDGCYTMTFPPGYYSGVVADNKAGAYDIQIYDPSAPPPVTIRWGSVEKAAGNVPKGPNKKYLILNVENYGTSPQNGYVEIAVVDENRGQAVFSDQKYITVPAGTTGRFDVYADTTNWPTTRMKATASLYSEDKKTFLGSNYAKFHCGVTGVAAQMLLLEGSGSKPAP